MAGGARCRSLVGLLDRRGRRAARGARRPGAAGPARPAPPSTDRAAGRSPSCSATRASRSTWCATAARRAGGRRRRHRARAVPGAAGGRRSWRRVRASAADLVLVAARIRSARGAGARRRSSPRDAHRSRSANRPATCPRRARRAPSTPGRGARTARRRVGVLPGRPRRRAGARRPRREPDGHRARRARPAHERRARRTRATPRSPCGCSAPNPRLLWFLPAPRRPRRSATRRSLTELVPPGWVWAAAAAGRRGRAGRAVAGPAARAGRPRAAAGRRAGGRDGRGPGPALPAGRGTAGTPRRRCARRPGPGWRPLVGLPEPAAPEALVDAVAARTGRPAAEVGALLYGAAPGDDAAPRRARRRARRPARERCADRDAPDRARHAAATGRRTADARPRRPARPAAEVGKAVVGQDAAVTGLVIALLCRGHVLLEGVPGVAKTLLVRALAAALDARHQAGAVHPRPDARRRHRLAGLRRALRRVLLPRGPGLHQPAARRRDQPHAAEDPGVAAGGDGGAAGLRRRGPAAAARPVRGRRHPEPGRVRGHLPAARGAARPLPAQARRCRCRSATRRSRS